MIDEDAGSLAAWLRLTLLPRWLARVYDPARPGFVEMLEADGTQAGGDVRTPLVTARLVYVFSHAHRLGVPGALEAASHGVDFLWNICRGSDGGFRHRCTSAGEALDTRSDFYDLAFVLFALGWHGRASGDASAFERADRVMGFLETALAHPDGGFAEDTVGTLPRRQNPHMHLLEACHALAEASGDPSWLARADALVTLMRSRMLDAKGSLGEFFTQDWQPAAGRGGLIREPGHHYEWTWLLHHHGRLTGSTAAAETADRIFAFAERHRVRGPHGCIVNEIDPDGAVLDGAALLWPQTEYLKALAARLEFAANTEAEAAIGRHLDLIFSRFVDRATGLWVNRIDSEGRPVADQIPVRVLYHLLLACAEIVRVRPQTRMP